MSRSQTEILRRVQDSLHLAESYVRKFRASNSGLLITNIILGAIVASITGGTAVGGKPVLALFGGWRILCSIAAVLGLLVTISSALLTKLDIAKRLGSAIICVSKLKGLELAMISGNKDSNQAVQEFSQILQEHPDCTI